jgi:prepilin-type N-terminal cleavage/methylation domain-containing protein
LSTGLYNNKGILRGTAGKHTGKMPVLRGFTLVELILVMVVICIVLAITSPSLRGFFASRQTADLATNFLYLTKYARSQAIVQGRPYRLNVDNGTFWLTAQENGNFVALGNDMGRRFDLPDGATLTLNIQTQEDDKTTTPGSTLAQLQTNARQQSSAAGQPELYLQFYPSGRCEQASVQIVGKQGEVFNIVCPSATESFRILSPSERPAS